MLMAGFEPARPNGQEILSLRRLPFRHISMACIVPDGKGAFKPSKEVFLGKRPRETDYHREQTKNTLRPSRVMVYYGSMRGERHEKDHDEERGGP